MNLWHNPRYDFHKILFVVFVAALGLTVYFSKPTVFSPRGTSGLPNPAYPADTAIEEKSEDGLSQAVAPVQTVPSTTTPAPQTIAPLPHFTPPPPSNHNPVVVTPPPANPTPPVTTTTSCPNSTTSPADVRQMWVWADIATNNKQMLVAGSQDYKDIFAFVDANKVQTAYMYLPAGLLNNAASAANLKAFLNVAKNQHCLSVEALDGDTNWIYIKSNTYALDFLNAVKNFNASLSSTDTKLVGLQYDVEPKNIIGNMTVANQFIDMLEMAKQNLAGTGILLDIAPTRWYDSVSGLTSDVFVRTGGQKGKSLMQYVFDAVDVMTVQDYTANLSSIYTDGKGELDYAATLGKKIRLGVDATKGDENNMADWKGMTCSVFNSDLTSVYNMMTPAEQSTFAGFSVETYKGNNNTPFGYSALCS